MSDEIIEINEHRAITLLLEVVAEAGLNYVYYPVGDQCSYAREGQPDCGIGRALAKAGVSIETLVSMDDDEEAGTIEDFCHPEENRGFKFTSELAVDIFQVFQRNQDSTLPWGECLSKAIRTYMQYWRKNESATSV